MLGLIEVIGIPRGQLLLLMVIMVLFDLVEAPNNKLRIQWLFLMPDEFTAMFRELSRGEASLSSVY